MHPIAALLFGLTLALAPVAGGADPLKRLETGNASKGWEAVGRLNLNGRGFCTGALIAPDLVLTAAHCLYDRKSGEKVPTDKIEFLAGWRNGRAAAYRKVRRVVAHPDYEYQGDGGADGVRHDLALMQLDQPIRLPSIQPYAIAAQPQKGDQVGVVSYARDRADAPSLEQVCHVLGHQPGVLVLSCDVDFGASGAPVFSMASGVPQMVSVVAAKAEMTGQKVALGTDIGETLDTLRAIMATPPTRRGIGLPQIGASAEGAGAKFVRSKPVP